MSSPVLVVCHLEHLQSKVFNVCCASWFDVDGVIWADFFLEAFEGIEKIEEEIAGIGVRRFEGYAKLGGIVRTCAREVRLECRRERGGTYTNTRPRVRVLRVLQRVEDTVQRI